MLSGKKEMETKETRMSGNTPLWNTGKKAREKEEKR